MRPDDTPLDAISAQVRARPPLDQTRITSLLGPAHSDPQGFAAMELVEHHLWIALDAALERRDRGLETVDLYQEGALAVVLAVEEFVGHNDPRAARLPGFVATVVGTALEAAIERHDQEVAADLAVVRDAQLLSTAEVALRRKLGRDPTVAELAGVLEWESTRVEVARVMLGSAMRIDDAELLPYLDDDELEPAPGGAHPDDDHRPRS